MLLQPGQVFASDFRIVRNLSAGGMGSVFVVEQLSTGNQRALKLMHPQLVADARLRERFLQEARVGSKIASDHVVQVLAAGIEPGANVPWLVMELLQGEELRKRVDRQGPIPWPEVAEIARQLKHALSAAHRVGIVHRDLKPDNLFLGESRTSGSPFTLKVLDFGIAKVLAEAQTTGTSGLGTPLWMAPEQAELKSQIDARTDIWAVGLIAFYCLTGRFFWDSANVEAPSLHGLMRELLIEPIVPASVRAGQRGQAHLLPPGFDGWFAHCVDREVARRFASVDLALDQLVGMLGAAQPRAAAPTGTSPAAPLPSMQHSSGIMTPYGSPPAAMAQSAAVAGLSQSYPAPPAPLHGQHHGPPHASQGHAGFTEHAGFGAHPGMGGPQMNPPAPYASAPTESRRGLVIGLAVGAVVLLGGGIGAYLVATSNDLSDSEERHRRRRNRSKDDDESESDAESEETPRTPVDVSADCRQLESAASAYEQLGKTNFNDPQAISRALPELERISGELKALPLSSPELKKDVEIFAKQMDELTAGTRSAFAAAQRGDRATAERFGMQVQQTSEAMQATIQRIDAVCPDTSGGGTPSH